MFIYLLYSEIHLLNVILTKIYINTEYTERNRLVFRLDFYAG